MDDVTATPEFVLPDDIASRLKHNEHGLFCAVAQDAATHDVLMVAWMNDEALARTMATGRATYFSRSRQMLWEKGESSGHTQQVRDIALDCDGDTVLLHVDQVGAACHTGTTTCFDDRVVWVAADGVSLEKS